MTPLALPWLLALVLAPAVGALVVARVRAPRRARLVAVVTAGVTLAVAWGVGVVAAWLPAGALLVDPAAPGPGGRPLLGVDALSGPLLVLTAGVALLVALGAPVARDPTLLPRALGATAGTLAALVALDLRLVALLWALSLVPVARTLEGGRARRVFAVTQGLGCACLLAAVGLLAAASAEAPAPVHWPALRALAAAGGGADHGPLGPAVAALVVVAVAARKALLPLHAWLPATFQVGSPGLAALLLAPQLGTYVAVRLLLEVLPQAARPAVGVLAALALATTLYGALLGLVQRDLRRTLGWLATSHSALVLAGLESGSPEGVAGALCLWLSFGVAVTGLSLAVGAAEARFGPVDLRRGAGLGARVPRLGWAFLVLGLLCVGLPGSLAFVSEDLLFHGALHAWPLAGVVVVLAAALNGFVVLRAWFGAFHGPGGDVPEVGDLRPREAAALYGAAALLLALGLAPAGVVASRAAVARALAPPSHGPPTHGPEPRAQGAAGGPRGAW